MKKLGMLSLIVGSLWLGACSDDDKDFSYEGQLDLNLLNLTQAREVWMVRNVT